jgi:hypothetical protein
LLPLLTVPNYYPDTNGDGYLTPNDVLVVINALNEQVAAEGESSSTFVTISAATADPSGAASQPAAPALYAGALRSFSSSNRDRFPLQEATDDVASGELPATQLLVLPASGENDNRHGARDRVLASSTMELTELEAALDAIAADLATNSGGDPNGQ